MPWLMKEVKKEMGNMIESRELLMGEFEASDQLTIKCPYRSLSYIMEFVWHVTEIIKEILENRAQTYRQLGEEYDASRDKRLVTEESVEGGGDDDNFANYQSPTTTIENQNAV